MLKIQQGLIINYKLENTDAVSALKSKTLQNNGLSTYSGKMKSIPLGQPERTTQAAVAMKYGDFIFSASGGWPSLSPLLSPLLTIVVLLVAEFVSTYGNLKTNLGSSKALNLQRLG